MNARQPRGLFIVVEGLDRSGKDTLIDNLLQLLPNSEALAPLRIAGQGAPVMRYGFPRRNTEIGERIDAFLRREVELSDLEIHELYSEDRRQAVPDLLRLLADGITIVSSRYAYSGAAYTAAKGYTLESSCSHDKGLPSPDLVVFIDSDPESLVQRNGYGSERFEHLDFQEKVYRAFTDLERLSGSWMHVDGRLSPEDSACSVMEHLCAISEHVWLPVRHDLFANLPDVPKSLVRL